MCVCVYLQPAEEDGGGNVICRPGIRRRRLGPDKHWRKKSHPTRIVNILNGETNIPSCAAHISIWPGSKSSHRFRATAGDFLEKSPKNVQIYKSESVKILSLGPTAAHGQQPRPGVNSAVSPPEYAADVPNGQRDASQVRQHDEQADQLPCRRGVASTGPLLGTPPPLEDETARTGAKPKRTNDNRRLFFFSSLRQGGETYLSFVEPFDLDLNGNSHVVSLRDGTRNTLVLTETDAGLPRYIPVRMPTPVASATSSLWPEISPVTRPVFLKLFFLFQLVFSTVLI